MNLQDIKTVEQAKALAFDTIQQIDMQQRNLQALQQRIVVLEETKKK
jgi:hypothetical protein